MARLIDANDLWQKTFVCDEVAEVRKFIEQAPTADAVKVPCKMGDMVWGIKRFSHGKKAIQGVVNQMYFGEDMRICICVKNVCRGEWGKNVFATKEDAEAAIGAKKNHG